MIFNAAIRGFAASLTLLTCTVILCGCSSVKQKPPIVRIETDINVCKFNLSPSEWPHLEANPIEFGLDYFTINAQADVTLLSVTLLDVYGTGFNVTDAVLVPGGGVGSTWHYGDPRSYTVANNWKSRISFAAGVSNIPATPSVVHKGPEREYELVVGATMKSYSASGGSGVSIAYRYRGQTFTVTGHDGFGVVGDPHGCRPQPSVSETPL